MSTLGPKVGSKKYKDQVITISTALQDLPEHLLGTGLLLYVFDETYARGAICEAEKMLRKKFALV